MTISCNQLWAVAFALSLAIQATVVPVQAQDCSEEKINFCLQTNQLCWKENVGGEWTETCTACIPGFIEFGARLNSTRCVNINNLDLQAFLDRFQPLLTTLARDEESLSQRRDVLRQRAHEISNHNAQEPPPSYRLVLNKFTIDTEEETNQTLGYRTIPNPSEELPNRTSEEETTTPPDKVDWVEAGAVTSVKDQGRCGCCWAVSMAGAIEGAAAVTSNLTYLQSVSFQQLISCNDLNAGCNGGNTIIALLYSLLNNFGGMTILNDYPYSDERGETTTECKLDDKNLTVVPRQGELVVSTDRLDSFETRVKLMKQVLARQPISIAMRSSCRTLSAYGGGILTDDGDCACSLQRPGCLDHAVLLVGYDDTVEIPYWKVKNSWSSDWGEDGYFRVSQARTEGSWGLFGILSEGVVPVRAYNLTEEVFDIPQETDFLETWAILLIVIACCLVCGAVLSAACRAFRRPNRGDESPNAADGDNNKTDDVREAPQDDVEDQRNDGGEREAPQDDVEDQRNDGGEREAQQDDVEDQRNDDGRKEVQEGDHHNEDEGDDKNDDDVPDDKKP